MKSYPSIPDNYADFYGRKCLAQVKYDGSNLRFLWTKKNGWCRYGTRTRLFDSTDELYGQALPIFERKYKEQLTWIIRNNKEFDHAKEVIAFAEFFGPSSFAGEHRMDEPKDLKLFDVNIGTRGFMSPFVFRATFKHLDIAETLYEGILDDVAGSSYFIGADTFHRVKAEDAITLLFRPTDCTKEKARVATLVGQKKVCPFSKRIPESELWEIIAGSLGYLTEADFEV